MQHKRRNYSQELSGEMGRSLSSVSRDWTKSGGPVGSLGRNAGDPGRVDGAGEGAKDAYAYKPGFPSSSLHPT